jgi:hypothetical protein
LIWWGIRRRGKWFWWRVVGVLGDVCREGITLGACSCQEDDRKRERVSSLGISGPPGGCVRFGEKRRRYAELAGLFLTKHFPK